MNKKRHGLMKRIFRKRLAEINKSLGIDEAQEDREIRQRDKRYYLRNILKVRV